MKVAVIGAGIIGVTTAYELSADGHRVTVFERCGTVAAETSFANAGVIAPGYVTPWASPGMPRTVLSHLFSRHTPVRLRGLGAGTLPWLWQWWRACNLRTYQANRLRMQRLATYSRGRLHELTAALKLDYERSSGYLVLLRGEKELALAQAGLASLAELQTRYSIVDADRCRMIEPRLNPDTELHAGIHLPDDEVGNCREFSYLLRGEAQRLGARFRFHTVVDRIVQGPGPQLVHRYAPPGQTNTVRHSRWFSDRAPSPTPLDTQPMELGPVTEGFDAIIVCAALGSTRLLHPLGLKVPLQAVHGYSVTAPLRRTESHGEFGPRSGLMDERYKVAISRLGTRVRVAGSAEIGGSPIKHTPAAIDTLYQVLHDWFPGSAQLGQAQHWKGARPMLPDGPPVIGRSGADGVWVNLGHGSSGWALSCGSARLLADAVVGRTPAIDIDGLGVERLAL